MNTTYTTDYTDFPSFFETYFSGTYTLIL